MSAAAAVPPDLFAGPVKRSVTIAGHQTSISLEPLFWRALEEEAAAQGLPLNALIARVDAQRIAETAPPNLASALRCWILRRSRERMQTVRNSIDNANHSQ